MKKLTIIFFSFCFIVLNGPSSLADSPPITAESHVKRGNKLLNNSRYFPALDEYREAIKKGFKAPVVYRNLAIIYSELGFLDEAIVEMKKAVTLSPDSDLLRMDLGVMYFAKEELKEAKKQFMDVLQRNPGFSDAYYYLGEIFYRTNDYDMAWLFARMAQRLGHKGKVLIEKLSALHKEPNVAPWNYAGDDLFIRQILVGTRERAETIVSRISQGELFEFLAGEEHKGTNSYLGGFIGRFKPSELHPKIAEILLGLEVLSAPVIVETEAGFHVIQQIVPFDFHYWQTLLADSGVSGEEEVHKQHAPQQKAEKTFIVYAGSFKKEIYAIKLLDRLRKLGYSGYHTTEKTKSQELIYTVVAGRYKSFQEAQEVGKSIARHGFTYFISQ